MRNSWGSENFKVNGGNPATPETLQQIIEEFPSKLKQAMYAASNKGLIKRRTWDGCVLNAAGSEIGFSVASTVAASKAFGITQSQASIFINCWDQLPGTDEDCTSKLREMIEKAGLFTEPGHKPPRIIRVKVYEDQQKKLREQFDSLMEANMIPDTEIALDLLTV